jgi:branched-chain amino acid transport system substrate-binding protein
MSRSRFQRGAAMLSASTLALGLVSAGVAVGSANASSPRVNGVTSNSVTIGATVPLSGIAASYAEVSAAANAVFKYVNTKGGINGRKINYIRLDDCYNLQTVGGCTQPPGTTTLSQTQVLVGSDHVFATVGSLGTAAQDSVRAYMKSTATPQLFVNSGSSDWNDPVNNPQLFGFQASYKVESKIFAKFIKASYAGKKVGFFGQNDDFGQNGYSGLTNGTGVTVASSDKILYNAADALLVTGDIATGVNQLKADNVKVVVLDSIPPVTVQILKTAHNLGFSPVWVISSVGSNPLSVKTVYEANAFSSNSLPATNDTKNVWNIWLRKVLAGDKTDFPKYTAKSVLSGNQQYGASFAAAFCEALFSLGKNGVTQAGIESAMIKVAFSTPSGLALKYASSNHQGLLGAAIQKVVSNGTNAPIYTAYINKTVYTTNDNPATPIASTTFKVATIPAYIK